MGGACTKSTVTAGEHTEENDMLDKQLEESKAREELHFKVNTTTHRTTTTSQPIACRLQPTLTVVPLMCCINRSSV